MLNQRQRLFIDSVKNAVDEINTGTTMTQEGMGKLATLIRQSPDIASNAARVIANPSSDHARKAVEDCIRVAKQ